MRMEGKMLEMFEVGPCEDDYHLGFLIGERFPQPLIKALSETNQNKFPRYWDELLGTAEGSGMPILDVVITNCKFDQYTPALIKSHYISLCSMAIAAHNEDANVSLVGHNYLIKGKLSNGLSFIAYTYAGELPSCAFGFNSRTVPLAEAEIVPAGIGRNFISRDLLEASSITDALAVVIDGLTSENTLSRSFCRTQYNLIDIQRRMILM
ncbi:Detected protein of unknown function [Hibiscus syriacus]|uniref:Peptidase C45 hydrolase domain-containing protein n=1 Tax=Hibiscus syriacus TaxID=106335 RepID=A0A6A2YY00_HIBSY|nr:Detected protein of unknown function [Hibiscus syriacus]